MFPTSVARLAVRARRRSPALLVLSSAILPTLATSSTSPSAAPASCFPASASSSTSSTLALLIAAHSSLPSLLCDPRFLLVPPPHELFLLHSCPFCFLLFLLNFPQTFRRPPRERFGGFPLLLLDRQER